MNSCVLMVEIIKDPELRYTMDNQTPITEMLVRFPGLRAEDPAETLKVVGWGNLAQQIQEQFHQGDHVVIEGRLNMNTIERPEGFREKRAELTAARIHPIGAASSSAVASSMASTTAYSVQPENAPKPTPKPTEEPDTPGTNYDDIPF